jgi:hypothetical protein
MAERLERPHGKVDLGRSLDVAFMDAEFADLVERAKQADRKVGNCPPDFDPIADFAASLDEAYRVIRERKAAGGPGWTPKEPAK